MSTLRAYLEQKRAALLAKRAAVSDTSEPFSIAAHVRAEGRSGVRRIRIRDYQILSDSPDDFAGYGFGPGSPEIQLGVLGSCVTHTVLIQAADLEIPLDNVEVEVSGQLDPRAGRPGFEDVPVFPHNISYDLHLTSPAAPEDIERLLAAVERTCPILNLLRNANTITRNVHHHHHGHVHSSTAAHAPVAAVAAT